MKTGRYSRIIVTMLMLLMYGASEVWADITVTIETVTNGTITSTVNQSTRVVTLTVTPDNGYYITSKYILAEKIKDFSSAPRRNTPGVADYLPVTGPSIVQGPQSGTFTFTVPDGYDGAYVTAEFKSIGSLVYVDNSTSLGDSPAMDGTYILTENVSAGVLAPLYGDSKVFTGTLDGEFEGVMHTINMGSSSNALFNTISGGTVKNIILEDVDISGGTNVGAIANEMIGTSDNIAVIFNCGILSGSVSGSGKVGGLVGQLGKPNDNNTDKAKCYARVINCFSYADVEGGSGNDSYVGGIVGYNCYASTANNVRSMVMNCMFYGDIKGGNNASPVYGGKSINNLNSGGLNTFNFYAYDELKTTTIANDKFFCALAVEKRFLNRFEIYRQLLNSNKKLAAKYASTSPSDMAKWVLETADRTISDPKPYPVLKPQGKYPSIINFDAEHAQQLTLENGKPKAEDRKKGGKLNTLSVTIRRKSQKTSGGQSWPSSGDVQRTHLTLVRTDMDEKRFNYNYDKVQLPYYNDVGTGNYTDGRVVTGWKITGMTVGSGDDVATQGSFTKSDTWDGYNFADRKKYAKDLYSETDRIFSQGAYFDVPYGVTAIEIEPYWGYAAFLADQYYDVVYNGSYSRQNVTQLGTQVESTTTFNGLSVKYTVNDALSTITTKGSTVYDNAIVLVGNFHQTKINAEPFNGSTPFTLMSVDEDHDNEPDYSLIYHDNARTAVCPIRFDFINIPGTAQAQKPKDSGTVLNASVFNPKGWFEITNTCLIYFSQFEYENNTNKTDGKSPVILLGGVYDQFVSTKQYEPKSTTYLHVGANAWFHDFGNGTHSDGSGKTKHIPISVTGGDFEGFYLTGTYVADGAVYQDDAECYISGGHFKEAAGAGQEQINGNVHWQIYDADIENFYGGGIKAPKTILGDVTVDICNSYVTTYCGGPKFGDMQTGKKVTTNATGCVFDNYFGAGYGGTSIKRQKYFDYTTYDFNTLQNNYINDRGYYFDGSSTALKSKDDVLYGYKGPGVAIDFDYEFFVWTSGTVGARFFVKFASFSLAQCNEVESKLKKCIINQNFYGGGKLGKVTGNVTSELDGCKVKGNVFGAGFSATNDPVEVRDAGFGSVVNTDQTISYHIPTFNKYSGMFEPGTLSGINNYGWSQVSSYPTNGGAGFEGTNIITTENLDHSNLGSVDGLVTLTIKGDSKIGTDGDTTTGNVYGGGDESYVIGSANKITVTLKGNAEVLGNVYGGGNNGDVEGSTEVNIENN